MSEDRGRELIGQKEIAAFMGLNRRTVMSYIKNLGLPVYKRPGTKFTIAYTEELTAWKRGEWPPNQ
jgi:hypothetical protein